MKKEELIQSLRNRTFNTQWCKNDFEKYDVQTIEHTNEPFFWFASENGTHLAECGAKTLNDWFSVEAKRFSIFRDQYAPIQSILYYEGLVSESKYRLIYFDGFMLVDIPMNQLKTIWNSLTNDLLEAKKDEYRNEWLIREELLPVRFESNQDEKDYLETCEFSDRLGDDSFARCIQRLTKYPRLAVNHYILISRNYNNHDYYFEEVINGQCALNGGIIYDPDKTENHWQIYT